MLWEAYERVAARILLPLARIPGFDRAAQNLGVGHAVTMLIDRAGLYPHEATVLRELASRYTPTRRRRRRRSSFFTLP